jgi:hypothetical protein
MVRAGNAAAETVVREEEAAVVEAAGAAARAEHGAQYCGLSKVRAISYRFR